jgi:hypothetical protein
LYMSGQNCPDIYNMRFLGLITAIFGPQRAPKLK